MRLEPDWAIVQQYLIVVTAFVATFIVLLITKKIFMRRLLAWAAHKPAWYTHLIKEIQSPLSVAIFCISLGTALQLLPDALRTHPMARIGSKVFLVLSIFWILD